MIIYTCRMIPQMKGFEFGPFYLEDFPPFNTFPKSTDQFLQQDDKSNNDAKTTSATNDVENKTYNDPTASSVSKNIETEQSGKHFEPKTHGFEIHSGITHIATCELILQANNFTNEHAPYTAYYACVPAHLILDERDAMDLLRRRADFETVNSRIDGMAGFIKYCLYSPRTQKRLTLRSSPIIWTYNHWHRSGSKSHTTFMRNMALLEVEPHEILNNEADIISLSEIKSAMQCQTNGTRLAGILPVEHPRILDQMTGICVHVGGRRGHTIFQPKICDGPWIMDRHIEFILDEG